MGGGNRRAAEMWEIASKRESFDVLVSCGCIRTYFEGGGAAVPGQNLAEITRLGTDVLLATRSFHATRKPSYEAPGRDPEDGEFSAEVSAQHLERAAPGITAFLEWVPRQGTRVAGRLHRSIHSYVVWMESSVTLEMLAPGDGLETYFRTVVPEVGSDMVCKFRTEDRTSEHGVTRPHTLLALSGRNDLIKAAAELSEAYWSAH